MSFLFGNVLTHLNAKDLQSAKTPAFHRGTHTCCCSDHQVHLISGAWLLLTLSVPMEAVYLLQHAGLVFVT